MTIYITLNQTDLKRHLRSQVKTKLYETYYSFIPGFLLLF
jgi:hypothetical protein